MRSHSRISRGALPIVLIASSVALITVGLLTVFHVISFTTPSFTLSAVSLPTAGDFQTGATLINGYAGVIMSGVGIAELIGLRSAEKRK